MKVEITYTESGFRYGGANGYIITTTRIVVLENMKISDFNPLLLQDPKWLAQFNYSNTDNYPRFVCHANSARIIPDLSDECKIMKWHLAVYHLEI